MQIGRLGNSSCLSVFAKGTTLPSSAWENYRGNIQVRVPQLQQDPALYIFIPLARKQTVDVNNHHS